MKWVRLDNNLIKLSRLATVLAANGFKVELRNLDFIITVPDRYEMSVFVSKLPIINQFIVNNRTININLTAI